MHLLLNVPFLVRGTFYECLFGFPMVVQESLFDLNITSCKLVACFGLWTILLRFVMWTPLESIPIWL